MNFHFHFHLPVDTQTVKHSHTNTQRHNKIKSNGLFAFVFVVNAAILLRRLAALTLQAHSPLALRATLCVNLSIFDIYKLMLDAKLFLRGL